ncbi:DUF6880 family protein [Actinosynnema pretiosum]|uniref:Uncharacterized protein n=1 Tax=Actinosynnema pretiosum TaxID=42197 RepID=A0A290Z786_9PSEU|nr:DUF6880 family protein [Actinosynnema pretiosum]ATE54833.1 hypothetical protein CNX65_17380 [Actinosynnema pretiosum]
MDALPDRVISLLRSPWPWELRWQGLASTVGELSDLVRTGSADTATIASVVEALLHGAGPAHRAAVHGLVDRVLDLHAATCAGELPDPIVLAEWLLHVQTGFPELPEVRLAPYAPALGERGLAHYRRIALTRFDALPVITFGSLGFYDRERWALLRAAEELAEHTGDVDLHVLVLSRNLAGGWDYLRIATVLHEAGRPDEALDWTRRGLRATGGRGAATRLVDAAVDECLRVGRLDDAVDLRWRAFTTTPTASAYLRLRGLAAPAGDWPVLRGRALTHLARHADTAALREVVTAELAASPAAGWLEHLSAELRRAGRVAELDALADLTADTGQAGQAGQAGPARPTESVADAG